MTEEEKRQFIEYLSLVNELRRLQKANFFVYLCGKSSTPEDIAKVCVFGSYEYRRITYTDPETGANIIDFQKIEAVSDGSETAAGF